MLQQTPGSLPRRSFTTRRIEAPLSSVRSQIDTASTFCNIPDSIRRYVGANLHREPNHPLCIVRERIEAWFGEHYVDQSIPVEWIEHESLIII